MSNYRVKRDSGGAITYLQYDMPNYTFGTIKTGASQNMITWDSVEGNGKEVTEAIADIMITTLEDSGLYPNDTFSKVVVA